MRRWYNTWMTVNTRPDARFSVDLRPIRHLTTNLQAMQKPTPYTTSEGRLTRFSWGLLLCACTLMIVAGGAIIHYIRGL